MLVCSSQNYLICRIFRLIGLNHQHKSSNLWGKDQNSCCKNCDITHNSSRVLNSILIGLKKERIFLLLQKNRFVCYMKCISSKKSMLCNSKGTLCTSPKTQRKLLSRQQCSRHSQDKFLICNWYKWNYLSILRKNRDISSIDGWIHLRNKYSDKMLSNSYRLSQAN